MTEYYRLNGQALTYAEYWRMSPGVFAFAVAALLKLLHCPLRFTFSIPRLEALTFLEPADIPEWVRDRWQEAVEVCQDEGLRLQFCYTTPVLERGRAAYAGSFLHPEGHVAAAAIAVRHARRTQVAFSCLTRLPGGRWLITSDQPAKMEPHPDDVIVRLVGADPDDVLDRHLEEVRALERPPLRIDPGEWPRLVLEREQRHVDFHIVRGVYVPMTEEEVEQAVEKYGRSPRDRVR
jgi:hypothetical protein